MHNTALFSDIGWKQIKDRKLLSVAIALLCSVLLHGLLAAMLLSSGGDGPSPAGIEPTLMFVHLDSPSDLPPAQPVQAQHEKKPFQTVKIEQASKKEKNLTVSTHKHKTNQPEKTFSTDSGLALSPGRFENLKSVGSATGNDGNQMIWAVRHVPKPEYPPLSRQRKEEGQVLISVEIMPDGRPGKLQISRSSGFERLDQAALKAAGKIVFVLNGQSPQRPMTVNVPYRFTLAGR